MHRKEIQMLEDRLFKADSLLQNTIKEKNSIASQAVAKEKELNELLRRQTYLKANVSPISK